MMKVTLLAILFSACIVACYAGTSRVLPEKSSICSLPPETGPCRAYFPRYFYNSASGKCEMFIYGGCLGNKNNFLTMKQCASACKGQTNVPLILEYATVQDQDALVLVCPLQLDFTLETLMLILFSHETWIYIYSQRLLYMGARSLSVAWRYMLSIHQGLKMYYFYGYKHKVCPLYGGSPSLSESIKENSTVQLQCPTGTPLPYGSATIPIVHASENYMHSDILVQCLVFLNSWRMHTRIVIVVWLCVSTVYKPLKMFYTKTSIIKLKYQPAVIFLVFQVRDFPKYRLL